MNQSTAYPHKQAISRAGWWLLFAAFAVTLAVYWPGLSGGYLFDDYPNIVDNTGVQPQHASVGALVRAALSSPSSEFARPLASLSFAANYLVSGLNPYGMKLTNLIFHLFNGLLVFLLARGLIVVAAGEGTPGAATQSPRAGIIAALIAAGWMLLPINLTGVLYVVQRMESMANLFVLLGLIGYVAGRCRMLRKSGSMRGSGAAASTRGFILCAASITLPTALGILAKETAVMLPLYAFLLEWILFRFQRPPAGLSEAPGDARHERRLIALFVLVLALPAALGLAWLLPGILKPETWATRDFTLGTRLLSETRIVVDYILWTLLPTPHSLSFYHDNFQISTGLLTPWTTLASMLALVALLALIIGSRRRQPLVALGLALFLGCQLLTATILPLELVYEHRNYFASFGLMLAIIPLLAAPARRSQIQATTAVTSVTPQRNAMDQDPARDGLPMALPRYVLLGGLLLCWATLTVLTAYAWGNPLRLADDLAGRAPDSPRALYEQGRTYIIYSHYDPASPFTKLAYGPLEKAAALPGASILPEQALIFMNARMHLPLKDSWWATMIAKLKARKPTVQDESSLAALTQCARKHECSLPQNHMIAAYLAALSHPDPSARLLADYSDYCWNVLGDRGLAIQMIDDAVKKAPAEPAYLITQVRMLSAESNREEALKALHKLQTLNYGGRLNSAIAELRELPNLK